MRYIRGRKLDIHQMGHIRSGIYVYTDWKVESRGGKWDTHGVESGVRMEGDTHTE